MKMQKTSKSNKLNFRYESFGGIISSEEPPFLAHVDKDFVKKLGYNDANIWLNNDNQLTAPLEVHFSVTNKCTAGCKACYTDSLPCDHNALSQLKFKEAIDILSDMKVFHLAMGGGEALERNDFFELAEYVREKGIIPNLTTNGLHINEENVEKLKIFGQVNISIDGLYSIYEDVRGNNNFSKAWTALKLLKKNKIRSGINCVVTRNNFDKMLNLAKFAQKEKVYDIEFLRIKPTGRAKKNYSSMKLTAKQNIEFYPLLRSIAKKTKVRLKADCSFLPMIAYHKPNKEIMEQFSVYGCEAGSVLLGVNSAGNFAGCSFLQNNESIFDLKNKWNTSEHLSSCRSISNKLPSPCSNCDYLSICKGGCRAVANFYNSNKNIPDPECPILNPIKEI